MARFDIISKDGNTIRFSGKPRYSGSYLKPSFLEFSEISVPSPIAWEVGDYVDYPRTGMRYRLYSIPQPSKNARKGSHGGAFTYSNIQFHAATKELEIALFRDLVANDNNIHFSTSPDVATFEDVAGIARRIQACLDDFYPNRWEIRMADFDATADADVIERINTPKDFALSGGTCLDALSKIYELWQDIGWIHTHEDGVEVITIGYANRRIAANTTDAYLYGKGNGLTAIKKSQTNKDEFATRLYVYGSDRNLPSRYYNGLDILNAESVDIRNLMLPLDKWGATDGLPDARKAYLENADAVAKFGVIPKTHYFDSTDAGADIHPSIEGMTIGQIRKALADMGETKYSPNASIYPNDSERVDEIWAAPRVMDDGVLKRNGKEHDIDNGWYLFAATTPGTTIPKGTAEKTAVVENHLIKDLDIDSQGIIRAKITFTSDKICTLADAGYESVSGVLTLANSLDSPSIEEEMGFTFVLNDDGVWEGRLPKVIANYDKQSYVRYVAFATMSVYVTPKKALASDVAASVNISDGYVTFIADQLFDKTFQLTLKQIGFDINERAAMGEGKVISMKTGMCAGRNFVISECRYVESTDKWSLVCRRQQDDTLGMLFPNKDYQIAMGDQFVLLDIALPEVYIRVNQERLLTEGEKLLAKASKIQSHYEPMIDAKVMIESGRTLREGMYMEISDEDVIDNGTDYILIDTLSIYEDESAIPTYKVTLREKRKVTYKGTPSATSETSTKSYGEEQTVDVDIDLSDYATKSYVDNAISSITPGGGGAVDITIDTTMSDTSTNAVQNKVIKKYVDQRAEQAYGQANEYTDEEIAHLEGVLQAEIASKAGAFYVEPSTNLFIVFTTEEKKNAYIASGDESGVLGKFAIGGGGGASETVYSMKINGLLSTYGYTTSSEAMPISCTFKSQVKYASDDSYTDYDEDAVFTVSLLKNGGWVDIASKIVSNGATFNLDLKPYMATGGSSLKVTAVGIISGASDTKGITVNVSSLSLTPFNFNWWTPFIEGQSYGLGGLKILGSLSKKLHIKVTGSGYSREYTESIGTEQHDEVAYKFNNLVHPSSSGVYKVELWLTADSGELQTETLSYNIMCIASEDVSSKKLICLNEVATELQNYTENKLFAYAVYNGGALNASPSFTVVADGKTVASGELSVNTGVANTYSTSFAIASSASAIPVTATATYGNTITKTFTLDNEASFAPVSGYTFLMDAAKRSNSDAYRNYFINEANQEKIYTSWKDMAWVDGMDGWTTDAQGNKCLLVPAMSKASVNLAPMKGVSTFALEMLYRVDNVADFDEDIITIATNTASSWMGLKIKPTNICLHSQTLGVDDLRQSYNTQEDTLVHLMVTVITEKDNGIGNIAIIYVNGVKKCSFEWSSGDTFAHSGELVLGSDTADLYLYKMRMYNVPFSWPQVMQNYISSLHTISDRVNANRKEESVLNDSNKISYDKVYGVYNTFIVELPKGASLPNAITNPSNEAVEGTNLYINIIQDPSCTIQGDWLNVPLEGQGTTAMTYYRWNLRSKTDDNDNYNIRITAKKNVASSMHSHKRGATALYNDLNRAIVGANEANGRVAVYQYPVYGFLKIENEAQAGTYIYDFIGLYTIGPDKGDKPTFGYDNKTYKSTLIHMEGTDHSPRGVGMDYPWEQMTVGLNVDEDAFIGAKNASGGLAEEAWEIGACGDKKTAADMKAYLDVEFAPAYKLDYECTPMIAALPSGETIASVNANLNTFRAREAWNGFTYGDCIIFDSNYNTYYFNEVSQSYVADGRKAYEGLTSSHGFSTSALASASDKAAYIRQYRRLRYRAEMEQYWHLDDSLFHACFLDLIGATDNEKKNSYPYKFGTLASGSRWRWRQDDLDTIFDVNNQGSADKKYSIMNTDKEGTTMIFKGNTSYHWRCVREYYKDEMKAMMQNIMDKMVTLCPASYGSSKIEKLVGCIRHYFWDYAQEYFTGGAYNADAKWTYEDTWVLWKQDSDINAVHPLQQSLGSHYEAEKAWVTLRMLFLASMNEWGAFVDYVDRSAGQVSFRQGGNFTFSLVPAIDMRPSVIQGANSKKIHASGRVLAGHSATIATASDSSADTMVYIQGADWLQDIGDFSKAKIGSSSQDFAVTSKRLQKLKVGDSTASNVETNIDGLTIGYCPSLMEVEARNVTTLAKEVNLSQCPRLRKAYFGGTKIPAITLADGSKVTALDLPSTIQRMTLRKLPLLRTSGLTYADLNNLTYLWVEDNAYLDGYDMLKSALEDGSPLNNIRVIGFNKTASAEDTDFLLELANGEYHGITPTGAVDNTIPPVLVGTVNYDTIDGDVYDALKAAYGDNLTINYNKLIAFIKFADDNVKAVLITNGVDKDGDGGITREEAEAVTSIGTWFRGNTAIQSFDELKYFIGVTDIKDGAFNSCTSLASINLDNVTIIRATAFYGCSALNQYMHIPQVTILGNQSFRNSGIVGADISGVQVLTGGYNGGAFGACSSLREVIFSPSLTDIQQFSFINCTSLESANIPASVTAIGNQAFYNCTSLAFDYLNLPNLTSLGQNAFYGVKIKKLDLGKVATLPDGNAAMNYGDKAVLEEIVLPEGITTIPRNSFQSYTNLKKCVIPKSVVTINQVAFDGATQFEGDVDLPNLTTLGQRAFTNTKISSFSAPLLATLPGQLNGLGTFDNCSNLKLINIPLVSIIPSYSFRNCSISGAFTLNVTEIHNGAFYGNDIEELNLPNIVTINGTSYNSGAFANNTLLKKVDIGESCTKISRADFALCSALETFICRAVTPPTLHAEAFSLTNSTFLIYVPDASVEAYKGAAGWSSYATRIFPLSDYTE